MKFELVNVLCNLSHNEHLLIILYIFVKVRNFSPYNDDKGI